MQRLEDLIRDWDGEAVITRHDSATGCWIFIALHSSVLGPCTGGTRLHPYPSPADGLRDAMRLAAGMTDKWAALELPMGGGKAVLAWTRPLAAAERRDLLLRYGDLVDSLRGAFGTGEDLGTSPDDMAIVARRTRHVHGVREDGSVTDPGPFTARGVFRGIEAAVHEVLGREDLQGVRVLVQGVGDVGGPLCRLLDAAGARLIVADPDAARIEAVRAEMDAAVVDPHAAYETPCDVFSPCAVGAVLSESTIPGLRSRIVAGSANNQLARAEDAERMHERGIVYAPDYVINAGGALALSLYGRGERDRDALMTRMDRIGEAVGASRRLARRAGASARCSSAHGPSACGGRARPPPVARSRSRGRRTERPFGYDPPAMRDELRTFLDRHFPGARVERIAGDASTRVFHRLAVPGGDARVLMDYGRPFEGETDDVRLNRVFRDAALPVAEILGVYPDPGCLLLEDLGDCTMERALRVDARGTDPCTAVAFPGAIETRPEQLYADGVDLAASIATRGTPALERSERASGPVLDGARFRFEMDHFVEHYVCGLRGLAAPPALRAGLHRLAERAADAPVRVLCHRDLHSRNLLVRADGSLAMVDIQDARWGPDTYDLASLLYDAYVDDPDDLRDRMVQRFRDSLPHPPEPEGFSRRLDLVATQRMIKALGTFGFQVHVRGVESYLRGVPRTLRRLDALLPRCPETVELHRNLTAAGLLSPAE